MHSRYILFETYSPNFACGKRRYVTTQTQYFSLYYVAMDIVAKEQWVSDCNYKYHFATLFSAVLMLILHAVIAENRNDSRASKSSISKINLRLLIAPIKVVDYNIVKLE